MITTLEAPRIKRKSKQQDKQKEQKPSVFNVLLHNDDYNTFGHVVQILCSVLAITVEQAILFAVHAHKTGQAIIYTGTLAEAEQIKDKIIGYVPDQYTPAKCEPTRLIASLQRAVT